MKAKTYLFSIMLLAAYTVLGQNKRQAGIYIRNAGKSDTISFSYWNDLLCNSNIFVQDSHKKSGIGAEAMFRIPVKAPRSYTYCWVQLPGKRITGAWPVQAGDSITIDLSSKIPRFSGKGAARFRYYQWMDSMYNDWSQRVDSVSETLPAGMRREYSHPQALLNDIVNWKHKIDKALVELNRIRSKLSAQDYAILQAELIGKAEGEILYSLLFYSALPVSFPEKDKDSLVTLMKDIYLWQRKQYVPDAGAFEITSLQYCSWLLEEAVRAPMLYRQQPLAWITSHFTGKYKDRLATAFIFRKPESLNDSANTTFTAAISSPYYRRLALPLLSNKKQGSPAFPFALRNTGGRMVTLEDFRGKLLVMDFWFTGCNGCVQIAPVLEQVAAAFTADDPIRFISVSLDTDRQQWLASIQLGKYTSKGFTHVYTNGLGPDYPMLSYYSLVSMPSLIIIDANGRLLSMNRPKTYTQEGIDEYIAFLKQAMPHK